MKDSIISFFILFFSATIAYSQQQYTVTLYPYNMPGATGYVDTAGTNISGDMKIIGNTRNKAFLVFDTGNIPAGAQISEAALTINRFFTYNSGTGLHYAKLKGLPVNTIYGKTNQQEIIAGPVYSDNVDWFSTGAPITGTLNADGLIALQKKIGTAFFFGIDPPTTTLNYRDVYGYTSTDTVRGKPVLRVTYQLSEPSKPTADFVAHTRDTLTTVSIRFYDNSGNYPTSWLWDFGDSTTSTEQNPSHAYSDTGSYAITLTARNAQGEDLVKKEKFIRIKPNPPPPVAEFVANDRNPAENGEVIFTDLSTGYVNNWKWNFGDKETDSVQNPTHLYAKKDVYSVTLIVSGPFGGDTLIKQNYINVGGNVTVPIANFGFDNTQGLKVFFSDSSLNFPDTWSWDFGDQSTIETVQNPTHNYAAEGSYMVCLTASNIAGTDTLCKQVPILKTGIASVSSPKFAQVYPNPFQKVIHIDLAGKHSDNSIVQLYDHVGKLVLIKKMSSQVDVLSLDGLTKGLYLLRLNDGKNILTKKLVKD